MKTFAEFQEAHSMAGGELHDAEILMAGITMLCAKSALFAHGLLNGKTLGDMLPHLHEYGRGLVLVADSTGVQLEGVALSLVLVKEGRVSPDFFAEMQCKRLIPDGTPPGVGASALMMASGILVDKVMENRKWKTELAECFCWWCAICNGVGLPMEVVMTPPANEPPAPVRQAGKRRG